MSDSVQPHRRQPTRLPCPWESPGKNTGVGCHFLLQCMKVKSESEVTLSCPTLSDSMDCSLPGSSVHGIFQARVLEWGAIAFSNIYIYIYIYYTYAYIHIHIHGASLVAPWYRICLQCKRPGFNPCVGKISWRRAWQPTLVLLTGEFHGQRSLVGYSPWVAKSDRTQ